MRSRCELRGWAFGLAGLLFLLIATAGPTRALDAVPVPLGAEILDLSDAVDYYLNQGESIQISTAPDPDGIVRRIEILSQNETGASDWIVFALSNPSDEQIERLLVTPEYSLVGSGLIWPDLGSERLIAVTPSEGFRPVEQESDDNDIFVITLNPGAIVTFIAELGSENLPYLQLWEPEAYKEKVNSFTLYHGVVLGISGLLALFLSVLFVVKGTAMFPATALFAWAVFAYVSIDFGFWVKAFPIASVTPVWRAVTEVLLAGALVIFLYTYLHLHRWHVRYSHVTFLWLLVLAVLLGVIFVDPAIAAGLGRISLGITALVGLFVVFYFSLQNFDRAINLVPAWLIFVFWTGAAWLAISGQISSSIVQPALAGGLVLLVMLLAFTIMQHAFAGGALAQGLISDAEQKALALVGAGHSVWDWDVARDRIETSRAIEEVLGVAPGALNGPARNWVDLIHPQDRERFGAVLDGIVNQRRGRISQTFRMRSEDGIYVWFFLRARPIVGSDGEVMRCTGTIADVSDQKTSEERLLHDAVHDNQTGLPNSELFMDRLQVAMSRSRAERLPPPTVLMFDIDRFKAINDEFGMPIGNSVLLAVSRRLTRLLRPQDTLARTGGNQFAAILLSETDPAAIEMFVNELMAAIRTAIGVGDKDIFLTASVGIAPWTEGSTPAEQLSQAETASYKAKRLGGDRLEFYRPGFSGEAGRADYQNDLKTALEKREIVLVYQPIYSLPNRTIAGFSGTPRWDHARRGRVPPEEIVEIASEAGLAPRLANYLLERAGSELAVWHNRNAEGPKPFISIRLSGSKILRFDLVNDVKAILSRNAVADKSLMLAISESMMMLNPEYATKVLGRVRELKAGLVLDDFGTGSSSLAFLERFPFDTIRINMALINPHAATRQPVIVRSIIALAHDLGMTVIANGVETEAHELELMQIGCDYSEGPLYGKAVSSDIAGQMLLTDHSLAKAS